MSTALLQELHQELRRLYIAGSDLAAGDFRLKRMLPQFQQLGERAPVFKRLAEGITALVEPTDSLQHSPAECLQDVTLLLESVLRTQGSTAVSGELGQLHSRPTSLTTFLPYRKLADVERALTTTGSGRHEIIVHAFEEGMFQDLRLMRLAINALQDPYTDIVDYTMKHVLPGYGEQIVPHLVESFDAMGGKLEARKLKVIGQVGGEDVLDLIYQAAESGSDDVRIAGIGALAKHQRYESSLLEWSKDKKKSIREAAYFALAEMGTDTAAARLHEAFSGKDIELAAEASAKCASSQLIVKLVNDLGVELHRAVELKDDKKKIEVLWARIQHYLTGLDEKRSEELYARYKYTVEQYAFFISLGWMELIDYAASYLSQENTEEALQLLQQLEQNNARYVPHAFRAAFQQLSPAELFDQYVESMRNKWKIATNKETNKRKQQLFSVVEGLVIERGYKHCPTLWGAQHEQSTLFAAELIPLEQMAAQWDNRWLEWLMEQGATELVCAFASPGHKACQQFMLQQLTEHAGFSTSTAGLLLAGLERAEVDEHVRHEALMTLLEHKRNKMGYVFEWNVWEQLCQLPATYQERLAAVAPNYRYTAGSQLEYVLRMMQADGTGVNAGKPV
ncbi:HEAT repeat domain-containing protein [Paenibacillus sp. UMB4589-SE434]|uniref:HEAT repeat domain-containing protein n=1 Tax=Paenibacillus sp. UMB4589-SE434 TaxID=3046314 RepID=UPI00254F8A15|nr:HEAT repeat domain-containing protein [Paenibacillus sp. UMB4589-SE434]MDK8183313.1 HEAT repeat domain-containing protein [Paenibacillus sp. UMB4589-SE434]